MPLQTRFTHSTTSRDFGLSGSTSCVHTKHCPDKHCDMCALPALPGGQAAAPTADSAATARAGVQGLVAAGALGQHPAGMQGVAVQHKPAHPAMHVSQGISSASYST